MRNKVKPIPAATGERIEILEAFADLPDARRARGQRHSVPLCLALFTLAIVAGNKNNGSPPHPAILLVSAYLVERGLMKPPHEVECKTNEIKALPEFLKRLALKGVVFAFDAISTQKKLAI